MQTNVELVIDAMLNTEAAKPVRTVRDVVEELLTPEQRIPVSYALANAVNKAMDKKDTIKQLKTELTECGFRDPYLRAVLTVAREYA